MIAFVPVLVALQLAVPVRCVEQPAAWETHRQELGLTATAAAYYHPDGWGGEPAFIVLGPKACRHVRHATDYGSFVIGHEFAHRSQDVTGQPFDEEEADRVGWRDRAWWKARLRAYFRLPSDPPVVRLGP